MIGPLVAGQCRRSVRISRKNCTDAIFISSRHSCFTSSSRIWAKVRNPDSSSNEHRLIYTLPLLVHGSLARAGKVKSQTPKVEAQEKKKTPKGRAKKRMLYNRRFVNVTTLPGGKRRM
ncbi:ribosomal protein S30-domain-containing protein [Lentinula raphanica]|nr:ribosomal protein S30-domain-containing protein [Lentinula raphanica]